jgi:hypothetical protein
MWALRRRSDPLTIADSGAAGLIQPYFSSSDDSQVGMRK